MYHLCYFYHHCDQTNLDSMSQWQALTLRLTCMWAETGSLVHWQHGSMSCQIVKRVTGTCNMTPAPTNIETKGHGPFFYSTNDWATVFYYFDGLAYPRSLWNDQRKPPEKCGRSTWKFIYSLVFFPFLINRQRVMRQKKRHFLHLELHCLSEKKTWSYNFPRLDMCGQQWERNSACDGQIAGWQTTEWDKEYKEKTSFRKLLSFLFKVSLRRLPSSKVFFLPCDRKYSAKGMYWTFYKI